MWLAQCLQQVSVRAEPDPTSSDPQSQAFSILKLRRGILGGGSRNSGSLCLSTEQNSAKGKVIDEKGFTRRGYLWGPRQVGERVLPLRT